MAGNVVLKKNNIESAFRLYVYLKKNVSLEEEELLLCCLIAAYDGLMESELEDISGVYRVRDVLRTPLMKGIITFDSNLMPGRTWISVVGSKGMYKVSKDYLQKARSTKDIDPTVLRVFAKMLFNTREHADIIKDSGINNGALRLVSAAINVLLNHAGFLDKGFRNSYFEVELTSLGYIKNKGRLLNRRAYLLDKKGVTIKCS